MSPVLCGVDRSPEGQKVASIGAALASRGDRRLRLVHVVQPPDVATRPFATRVERQREAEELERAGHMGVTLEEIDVPEGVAVERVVEFGDSAQTLSALAAELPADMIVVGAGATGIERIVVGSTAAALAKDAPCPLVIVSSGAVQCSGQVLLCGVDASKFAAGVARTAAHLARCLMLELVLVHVSDGADADGGDSRLSAADAAAQGAPLEVVPARGSIAQTLRDLAQDRGAAMVLVGARGRGVLKAAVLGSVSSELTDGADRPVAVVPPAVSLGEAPSVRTSSG